MSSSTFTVIRSLLCVTSVKSCDQGQPRYMMFPPLPPVLSLGCIDSDSVLGTLRCHTTPTATRWLCCTGLAVERHCTGTLFSFYQPANSFASQLWRLKRRADKQPDANQHSAHHKALPWSLFEENLLTVESEGEGWRVPAAGSWAEDDNSQHDWHWRQMVCVDDKWRTNTSKHTSSTCLSSHWNCEVIRKSNSVQKSHWDTTSDSKVQFTALL